MHIFGKTLGISIFFKILSSLVVITLFFYSCSLLMNFVGTEKTRQQVVSFETAKLEYYVDTFENEIARIQQLQREYIYDSNIQKLSSLGENINDYEKSYTIKTLYEKLAVLSTSSPYIDSIKVHIPAIDRTITSKSELLRLEEQEFMNAGRVNSIQRPQLIFWKGQYYLNVLPANTANSPYTAPYSLTAVISASAIQKDMKRMVQSSGSGLVAYSPDRDWAIIEDSYVPGLVSEYLALYHAYEKAGSTAVELKIGQRDYILLGKYSRLLNAYFLYCFKSDIVYNSLTVFKKFFWLISILSFVFLGLFSYWLYYLFKRPVDRMTEAFKTVEQGNFTVSIRHKSTDEFRYLYNQFNSMVEKIRYLVLDVYEQKLRVKSALLKQLQYQINPHFLYNSFFIIYRMAAAEDYENIKRFSNFLSRYYRFINRNSSEDVTLLSEIEHCMNYVNIQAIRFGERIQVKTHYQEKELADIRIPSLIIQPIVENAYEHGLKNITREGLIQIRIDKEGPAVKIIVEDNGNTLTEDKLGELEERLDFSEDSMEMSGIVNVHRRLRLKYGQDSGVTVSRSELGGLKAEICIVTGGVEANAQPSYCG